MPIYEYHCKKCGEFDVMQKITEKPLQRCPTCRCKVTKLMSNTAFQLKGSGWYVTDYGNKGSSSSGDRDRSASTSSASGDSAADKTDSKAAKSDAKSSKSKGETAAA